MITYLQTIVPLSVWTKALPTLLIIFVSVAVIILLVVKPFGKKGGKKTKGYQTIDDLYNEAKKENESTIDEILEKIHKKGLHSLSKKEKEILTRNSDKSHNRP